MADRWWPNFESWLGSFVIFKGIRTSTTETLYFIDFSGGGGGSGPPVPSSGSVHESAVYDCGISSSYLLLSWANHGSTSFFFQILNTASLWRTWFGQISTDYLLFGLNFTDYWFFCQNFTRDVWYASDFTDYGFQRYTIPSRTCMWLHGSYELYYSICRVCVAWQKCSVYVFFLIL